MAIQTEERTEVAKLKAKIKELNKVFQVQENNMYWSIQARKCSKCGCETAATICPTCYAEEIRRDKERHQGYDHWKYFLGNSQEHGKDVATNVCEKSHKNSKTSSNNEGKQQEGEKMDKYSFTVTDPDQVDVDRIIKENPEAKIIAISLHVSSSVLVLIRESFAEKFTSEDQIHIGDGKIYFYSLMPGFYQYDNFHNCWKIGWDKDSQYLTTPTGWFCVSGTNPIIFEQIERVLNFKKKSVTVRTW